MPNNSSTGGYLPSLNGPAQGQALMRIIQQWAAALTALDPTLVVPAWQGEPPPRPSPVTEWAAISIPRRPGDRYPQIAHDDGAGVDHLYKNETLECIISFYGVGYDSLVDEFADRFRVGAMVPQNREALSVVGVFLTDVGDAAVAPVVFSERWTYRVDVDFRLRRTNARDFAVLSLTGATITLVVQDPAGRNATINVTV